MNNNNFSQPAASAQGEHVEEKLVPTVSLLPGDCQIVVKNIPKDAQGPWIAKNRGIHNSNPAVNGFVFPRSAIQAVRENVPGLVGGSSIHDPTSFVPIVFSTVIAKPLTKEKEKLQRQEMAKLGFSWNAARGQYEGDVSLHNDKVMTAIVGYGK